MIEQRSYLDDPALKAAFLMEITKHEEADALAKGTYGKMNGSFKGCAIGCSLHSLNILQGKKGAARHAHTDQHARYEAELGLPTWLAYLEDHIFESLSDEESRTWPREFTEAIPVGVVIPDRLLAKILHWSLVADTYGVRYATDNEDVRAWIDAVAVFIDADSQGNATADQREAAAWDAWDAWDAWAARAAWAAWAARAARDAWAAWAARAARATWAARAARDEASPETAAKTALFSTALARYVIEELRALAAPVAA